MKEYDGFLKPYEERIRRLKAQGMENMEIAKTIAQATILDGVSESPLFSLEKKRVYAVVRRLFGPQDTARLENRVAKLRKELAEAENDLERARKIALPTPKVRKG